MKRDSLATAHTLSEALPYLQRYDGATVVIKFGGHAMGDDAALADFARDIVLMKQCNVHPVVVHGGGPAINAMLAINMEGGKAVGLTGKDANLIICEKADPALGLVGKPTELNPDVLSTFINSDLVPVVAPIGMDADRLLLLTDVEGVKDANGDVLTEISATQVKKLTDDGTIAGGMIPKTETALDAIALGVKAVVILDGRAPHAVLLELFTEHGAGTLIRA